MTRTAFSVVIVLLVSAVFAATVHSTQIIYRSPKQMGDDASLVVTGKVSGVRSYWNDKQTKIFTETTVEVEEAYKGRAASSVRIIQMGGVVGTVRMHVHGALGWHEGEEVLLFLDAYGADRYRVAGFSQGKYGIERDPATGEAYVTRPMLEGTEVLGAPAHGGAVPAAAPARVPLDHFINDALGGKR
ncbi:MAG: hypothetical protein P8181_02385 [bacterium]